MTTSTEPTTQTDWYLPRLDGGEDKGLNDAGIQSFKGSQHLARETIQNIVDAHDPQSGGVAKAEFELLNIPTESIPGITSFRAIYKACTARVSEDARESSSGDRAQERFMQRGAQLLASTSIPVLRIRDQNTVGLEGDDRLRSSRWYRLVRGQGTPNREGASAGTYGIGQRAPFAFSGLRMVLYSTMLPNGSVRFMGKFILCTCDHPDDRSLTQNIGYFGEVTANSNGRIFSIDCNEKIPEQFRRETPGTDIYIIGFTQSGLKQSVTNAVLSDFFAAILRGKIEVTVKELGKDPIVIREDTIEPILASNNHGMSRKEQRTAMYSIQALRNPTGDGLYKKTIKNLGTVSLYITRDAEATDSTTYMRSPLIKVMSKMSAKLQDYQAVLVVDSDDGNEFLSRLEDPSHCHWHEDELGSNATKQEKNEARQARLALIEFVRETLTEIRGNTDVDSEDIPELARFLPLEDEDESVDQQSAGGTEPTSQTISEETAQKQNPSVPASVTVIPLPTQPITSKVKPGNKSGDGTGNTGGGGADGSGGGDGKGGEGDLPGSVAGQSGGNKPGGSVNLPSELRFRSWRPGSLNSKVYRLVLGSEREITGSLRLIALGERGEYPVKIEKARDLDSGESISCIDGKIEKCIILGGSQRRLEVEIKSDVDVSLSAEVVS